MCAHVCLPQGCAHNPTGIDPTKEQWSQICDLCQKKNHLPFFDVAYQGFATGSLEEDAYAPRFFVEKGLEVIVAQSYSVNLGLGRDCVGGLIFVMDDSAVINRIKSQLLLLTRPMYAFPPVHGSRHVTEVMNDPELFAQWKTALKIMHQRIRNVREKICYHLWRLMPNRDWSYLSSQHGIYLFIGFSSFQVLCHASLNQSIDYVVTRSAF